MANLLQATQLSPPFSPDTSSRQTGQRVDAANLMPTLPAAYHDHHDNLVRLHGDRKTFVDLDMDVSRLNDVHRYLWMAGRPTSARPLHRQKMMERHIAITEQADLHLVWHESRIFLKPLPDYLLSHQFWKEIICSDQELHARACGFLLSYVWLVCHLSDFRIASELGLLPSRVGWEDWTAFVDSFLSRVDFNAFDKVNKRYHYGELRLNRLQSIHRLVHFLQPRHLIRGYMYGYNRYTVFFGRNFAWLLVVFVYITVILTAMQVGLATDQLRNDKRFQRASYGFTIFSILSPIIIAGLASLLFISLFLFNFLATRAFVKDRRQYRQALMRTNVGKTP